MKLIIRKILNIIFNYRKNEKQKHLTKLAKKQAATLLDIGAAGNIEPRWLNLSKELIYIGVEPDSRSSSKLANIYNCKKYELIKKVLDKATLDFFLCNKPKVSSVFAPNREFLDKFPKKKDST